MGLVMFGLGTANIYLLQINNRNNREKCKMCLKGTINTLE